MIKKEIDTELAAQLIIAIITDVTSQLIMGCDETEIHEFWDRSISAVLGDYSKFNK